MKFAFEQDDKVDMSTIAFHELMSFSEYCLLSLAKRVFYTG